MAGCPLSSSASPSPPPSPCPSSDVIETLRKLQSVGYFSDLSVDLIPQNLSSAFNRILSLFQREIRLKQEVRPVPVMLGDGQIVDLFRLYSAVRERSGYESVTAKKGWASVAEAIGFEPGRGPSVKLVYAKYLGAFERWLEQVLAKKETPISAAIGELRAEVGALLLEAAAEPKKEEEGRATPTSGSKKNHFLTPLRDGGRRLKLDDDEKGNNCKGGGDDDDDVVIIEPEVAKMEVVSRRGSGSLSFNKRKRDALVGLLDWVLRVAKNPGDFTIGKILPSSDGGKEKGNFVVGELFSQALSARGAMFLKKIRNTDENVPSLQKGQKMFSSTYEVRNGPGILASEKLRQSRRLHSVNKQSNSGSGSEASTNRDSDMNKGSAEEETSTGKRKLRKCSSLSELNDIMACLLPKDQRWEPKTAKKIKATAVEVPPWTGKSSSTPYDSHDLKWLGTPIWPPENQECGPFEQDSIGKGRQDNCRCELPSSVECTRFHVAEKRVQLKRELGSAFHSWKFDCMGEEVALSWTEEEAQKFKTVVRLNPPSLGTNFWDQLHRSFPSKGTKNLVSYYFNVFVLGCRSYQNRVTPNNIDSDDEEPEFGFLSIPFGHDAINVDAPKSNFCVQNAQCVDIDD